MPQQNTIFRVVGWIGAAALGIFLLTYAIKTLFPELAPVEEGIAVLEETPSPAGPEAGAAAALLIGNTAPSFSLKDAEGSPHALSEWKGQPLVILFWASWSEESLNAVETLAAIAGRLPQLQYVAISSQEPEVLIQNYLRRAELDMSKYRNIELLLDPYGAATEAYRVQFLPTFALADASGKLANIIARPIAEDDLETEIAKLLTTD